MLCSGCYLEFRKGVLARELEKEKFSERAGITIRQMRSDEIRADQAALLIPYHIQAGLHLRVFIAFAPFLRG